MNSHYPMGAIMRQLTAVSITRFLWYDYGRFLFLHVSDMIVMACSAAFAKQDVKSDPRTGRG